jgi:hypothetical protein
MDRDLLRNQRLTLAEVEQHVEQLPDEAVELLAEGPVPDLKPTDPKYWEDGYKDCRACHALDPIKDENDSAYVLADWHGYVSKPFDILASVAWKDIFSHSSEEKIAKEMLDLMGYLAYTRCILLYSVARTVMLRREEAVA